MHMLCWNKVENVARWRTIFASHQSAHLEAGLVLVDLWLDHNDASLIHYLFEVRDYDRAMAFINAPDAAKAGADAGVIDGDCHFIESQGGY